MKERKETVIDGVVWLEPTEIVVSQGLPRLRQELGDIEGLSKSIKNFGQILPIVINRRNELIDGGRRLAACIANGIKVKAIYEDVKDEAKMRELEFEANCYRKDFTPAEQALAVKEFHRLKQVANAESGGWSVRKTAEAIGRSHASVVSDMSLADLVEAFPELKDARTKQELKKLGEARVRVADTIKNLQEYEEQAEKSGAFFEYALQDAAEYLAGLQSQSVDVIMTDPLYGINADQLTQGLGGRTGGVGSCGYKIQDKTDDALGFYKVLADHSYRVTKPGAHGWIFTAPEHFYAVREMFVSVGWRGHVRPVIWIKRASGQCNVPYAWPSSAYEMLLYIRKDESRLVQEGMPDWLQVEPVALSVRIHPYEKPVGLITALLKRVVMPGMVVLDPFAGSGAVHEAAMLLDLYPKGCDIDGTAYASALRRLTAVAEGLRKSRQQVCLN